MVALEAALQDLSHQLEALDESGGQALRRVSKAG